MEFKTKKVLTRPVLKFTEGVTHYVKIEAAMFIGKEMKQKAGDDKKKEPATILNVIDLESGEVAQMLVNAVVKSVLTEEYPNDSYVGKCFALTKMPRQPGKQYNPFHVNEIEDPTPAATNAADIKTGTAKK